MLFSIIKPIYLDSRCVSCPLWTILPCPGPFGASVLCLLSPLRRDGCCFSCLYLEDCAVPRRAPPRPAMTDTRSAEPASHLTTLLLLYDFPNRTGKRQGAHFSASPRDSASRSAESTSLGFPSGFQKLIPLIKIKEIKKSIRLLHDLPLPSRPTPPAATVSPPLN